MTTRHYCITQNKHPKQLIKNLVKNGLPPGVRYLSGQLEKKKRLHFQGYIEFTQPQRVSAIRKIFGKGVHAEARRGTREQARDYSIKEDTRYKPHKYEPIQLGKWIKGQGARQDLEELYEMIKNDKSNYELLESNPSTYLRHYKGFDRARNLHNQKKQRSPPKVYVLWGEPGSGKTSHVYRKYPQDQVYSLMEDSNGKVWFDGYEGQSVLLIDDFYGWIKYSYMLKLLDRYPIRVQTKGGSTPLLADIIYITSNTDPKDWYPNISDTAALQRRFKRIIHVKKRSKKRTREGASGGPA